MAGGGGTGGRILRALLEVVVRSTRRPPPRSPSRPGPRPGGARASRSTSYPGDYEGPVPVSYAPNPDGAPDPGEVVWTWVPFEEDHARGKDRPVLVVGQDGPWLLGLTLTSTDHGSGAELASRRDRRYMDLGAGGWDARGRPSEVRLDRVVRVDPMLVRREGARLPRELFDRVTRAMTG